MANPHRPAVHKHAARAARTGVAFAKYLVGAVLVGLSYVGLTAAAMGPSTRLPDAVELVAQALPQASIHYSGTDAIITGSVGNLFESGGFSGPNRSQKTARFRPEVDVLTVARGFAEVRMRLAALRAPPPDPTDPGQTRFADATPTQDSGPRISVAAIDFGQVGALTAIDAAVPLSDAPIPAMASAELAYARAIAPITGEYGTTDKVAVSDKELWCLATAVYFEARGESYRGQVAVAQVVMNRTKHRLYPDTICGVVFENEQRRNSCQFSFACDGRPETVTDRSAWVQAQDIAKKVTDGDLYLTEVAEATHYHATYVSPRWAPRMHKMTQIGLHIFYRFKYGWKFG